MSRSQKLAELKKFFKENENVEACDNIAECDVPESPCPSIDEEGYQAFGEILEEISSWPDIDATPDRNRSAPVLKRHNSIRRVLQFADNDSSKENIPNLEGNLNITPTNHRDTLSSGNQNEVHAEGDDCGLSKLCIPPRGDFNVTPTDHGFCAERNDCGISRTHALQPRDLSITPTDSNENTLSSAACRKKLIFPGSRGMESIQSQNKSNCYISAGTSLVCRSGSCSALRPLVDYAISESSEDELDSTEVFSFGDTSLSNHSACALKNELAERTKTDSLGTPSSAVQYPNFPCSSHSVSTPNVELPEETKTDPFGQIVNSTMADTSVNNSNLDRMPTAVCSSNDDILLLPLSPSGLALDEVPNVEIVVATEIPHSLTLQGSPGSQCEVPELTFNLSSDNVFPSAANSSAENHHDQPGFATALSPQPLSNKQKRRKRPEVTPVKKRKVHRSRWLSTVAKVAYNSGEAHTSLRGKQVQARSMRPGCGPSCRRQCHTRLPEEKRRRIFRRFWDLKDHSMQWYFIMRYINILPVKQRKVPVDDVEKPWRNRSLQYNLYDPDTNLTIPRICQKMFLDTFDISMTWVKTAIKKMSESEGKISPDKRGKLKKPRPGSLLTRKKIQDHIKKFPAVESHYCRAGTKKLYLDENLSVAKMFRMYNIENPQANVTLRQYRDVFNQDFNISFYKPKRTNALYVYSINLQQTRTRVKIKKKKKYDQHIAAKDKSRNLKSEDIENSRKQHDEENPGIKPTHVITFDLQKKLFCPKGENAEFYYRRKWGCYNFTIFDCTTKEAFCYVWDETIGKKGSDEINSSLLDYIEARVKEGMTELICYSDNCAGQNKNKFLFSMYNWLAQKHKIKITHRWLIKGHTQMECDSVHARIELKTKTLSIFTPSQWYGNIKSAKVSPPFYKVKELDQDTIFNFRDLEKFHDWSKVPTKAICELVLDHKNPGCALFRKSFGGEQTTIRIVLKKKGRPVVWENLQLKPAYFERLCLSTALLKDLKWYVQQGHIPASVRAIYEALPNWSANIDYDAVQGEESCADYSSSDTSDLEDMETDK